MGLALTQTARPHGLSGYAAITLNAGGEVYLRVHREAALRARRDALNKKVPGHHSRS